jgi:hypothetical protein
MSESGGQQELQFDRVEGAAPAAAAAACASCQRTIPDVYYEAAGKVFCAQCREAAQASLAGGSGMARILKALALGLVAAAISAGVWYAIIRLTDSTWGIVAIAVGIAVGMAVRIGSEGRGGWVYQLMAVVLTYLAISTSYVPLVMEGMRDAAAEREAEEASAGEEPVDPDVRETVFLVTSVAISLALPVLQATEGTGIIGLLIVGFALYQAWKINTRQTLAFSGPFRVDAALRPGST